MAAMDFPPTPTVGQLYPDPPTVGVPQYRWDGGAWLAVSTPEDLSYVRRTGDTMSGPLTMSGAPAMITLAAEPTADLHAATKLYVDAGVGGVGGGLAGKVAKAGDTMTGPLVMSGAPATVTLSGDPTAVLHAATKQYVDTVSGAVGGAAAARFQKISLAGGTSFDVPVPAGAVMAKFTGIVIPTSAAVISVRLQVSLAAGVFKTAANDYGVAGPYHLSAFNPTALQAFNGDQTIPGMVMALGHEHIAMNVMFEGFISLKRPAVSSRFTCEVRGAAYTASGWGHNTSYHYIVDVTSGLNILALRLMSPTGANWAADSYLHVEWL